MSEQFKPGQKVWHKEGSGPFKVVFHQPDNWLWLLKDEQYATRVGGDNYSAADPNAKPQPCPFCDGPSATKSYGTSSYLVRCSLNEPCLVGPHKPTHEEAVSAWNSIRVIQPGEFTNDLRDALRKAADDCKFKDEPLTEEWLKKVGLWDGKYASAFEPMVSIIFEDFAEGKIKTLCLSCKSGLIVKMTTCLKTCGDARTLCRLLGVTLEGT